MRKYLPDVFDDEYDLFEDFDRNFFGRRNPLFGHHEKNLMKTDIRDEKDHYEMMVDLPGFKKDEIQLSLQDGYLTISAEKGLDKDENDKNGNLIRQERYSGALSRSYYIGESITEDEVKAKFEDGVLSIIIPKKEEKEELPASNHIMIE
ncbi:MAG: Hsp20/alpha crystallin family protein [Bulleidia sp.]|nr:Hsp20/alpha crystallin family protein [Bulleidia sp.]